MDELMKTVYQALGFAPQPPHIVESKGVHFIPFNGCKPSEWSAAPYPQHCTQREKCAGLSSCPRDPCCAD